MSAPTDSVNRTLQQYRAYLECLTYIQIDPRLRRRFGFSDVIQKTLIEAWQTRKRIEALEPEAEMRWLRRMFVHNLLEQIEHEKAAIRDIRREELDDALERSSCRLKGLLASDESSPPDRVLAKEQALRLAEALARLPERQREAIILQKWHGWKLAQIAERLGCTTGVVAGLHARGLKALRHLLPDME